MPEAIVVDTTVRHGHPLVHTLPLESIIPTIIIAKMALTWMDITQQTLMARKWITGALEAILIHIQASKGQKALTKDKATRFPEIFRESFLDRK